MKTGRPKRIRIGLVGTGGYAVNHRDVLAKLDAEGVVAWVAAADPVLTADLPLVREMKARGVHCHDSYISMLTAHDDLDAVVIATPIPLHYDMVGQALRRGLHVLLEKPPVPLLSELESLLAMPESEKVAVGFQHICSRPMRQLRRLIADGTLGVIREIRGAACWPRSDDYYSRAAWAGRLTLDGEPVFDGPATNALSHLIQNAMVVAALPGDRCAVPESVQGEFYRARPIESYDTVCLRGVFPQGIRFTAAFTHATRELFSFRFRVVGRGGTAEIGDDGTTLTVNGKPFEGWTVADTPPTEELYRDFAAFCRGDAAVPATTLADTRGLLTLTCGALEAAGAIHTIPTGFVEYSGFNGDGLYHVGGLAGLVERCLRTGALFSESGAAWAVPSPVRRTADLRGPDLASLVRQEPREEHHSAEAGALRETASRHASVVS